MGASDQAHGSRILKRRNLICSSQLPCMPRPGRTGPLGVCSSPCWGRRRVCPSHRLTTFSSFKHTFRSIAAWLHTPQNLAMGLSLWQPFRARMYCRRQAEGGHPRWPSSDSAAPTTRQDAAADRAQHLAAFYRRADGFNMPDEASVQLVATAPLVPPLYSWGVGGFPAVGASASRERQGGPRLGPRRSGLPQPLVGRQAACRACRMTGDEGRVGNRNTLRLCADRSREYSWPRRAARCPTPPCSENSGPSCITVTCTDSKFQCTHAKSLVLQGNKETHGSQAGDFRQAGASRRGRGRGGTSELHVSKKNLSAAFHLRAGQWKLQSYPQAASLRPPPPSGPAAADTVGAGASAAASAAAGPPSAVQRPHDRLQ